MVLGFQTWRVAILFVLLSALGSGASSDASAHLGAGLKLFDVQRYSEAAKEFERALESDPGLQDARYHLAVCDFNERQYTEARGQFERLAQGFYHPTVELREFIQEKDAAMSQRDFARRWNISASH